MREFIIYSQKASTAPFIRDLKAAGRIDVLLHSIISALFASNTFRDDVRLHLILMGPPNAPRHITIEYKEGNTISKKDMKKLLELCLRKAKNGETREVHAGVYVDDLTIDKLLEKFEGRNIFVLDQFGENIKEIKDKRIEIGEGVFVLGDHEGFDKQTKKFLKKNCVRMSLGKQMYFTSQAITIINYEADNIL